MVLDPSRIHAGSGSPVWAGSPVTTNSHKGTGAAAASARAVGNSVGLSDTILERDGDEPVDGEAAAYAIKQ